MEQRSIRDHAPLFKVLLAAIAAYGLIVLVFREHLHAAWNHSYFWTLFVSGAIYTQFFEWWYHKNPMHRGAKIVAKLKNLAILKFSLPILNKLEKLFEEIRVRHEEHHENFDGQDFVSRDPKKLKYAISSWKMFPILLFLHFAPFAPLQIIDAALIFFAGVTWHYCNFETVHWGTHIPNAATDFFDRTPVLGAIWRVMFEHHKDHHDRPDANFNFLLPFLGDIFGWIFFYPLWLLGLINEKPKWTLRWVRLR